MILCPPWCIVEHEVESGSVVHRGVTHEVTVVLEGRGRGGPNTADLLVEVSRLHDETAVWVYVGDGWTGFSLSLDAACRLSLAMVAALRSASWALGDR